MPVLQDRRVDHIAEHVAPQQPRQLGVEMRHVGQPAAQHDRVGIEQVDRPAPARAPAGRRGGPGPPARVGSPAAARAGMRLASCASGPSQSRASAGPATQVSRQPRSCRTSNAGPGTSSSRGQGSGLWPHSPATRMRAAMHLPVHHDAAAAAGAEDDAEHQRDSRRRRRPPPRDSAKQLASFSTRTSRPSRALMSRSNGWPFSAMELAFFTSPVAGLITPGMPMPTVAVTPSCASASRTEPAIAAEASPDSRGRRGDAMAQRLAAVRGEDGDLDLGAAEVDADAVLGHGGVSLRRRRRHLQAAVWSVDRGLDGAIGDRQTNFGLPAVCALTAAPWRRGGLPPAKPGDPNFRRPQRWRLAPP